MHATGGEWVWTVVIGLALLVSLELARQAWLDYRATLRLKVNGLRKAVSVGSLWNQIIPVLWLALLFGVAASSLFVEPVASNPTMRGLFVRWGSVVVALSTVAIQFTSLRRRRRMMDYARALEGQP